MERLLVTGIDGPLGANLAASLADRCEILGLSSAQGIECSAFETARWDGDDPVELETFFHQWQPQWIIHCSPLAAGSWDTTAAMPATDPARGVVDLAELASRWGTRFTLVSSDVVFAGPRMFHDESSAANSPAPRANLVRQMERAAEARGALVVRTHAYGWSPTAAQAGFAQRAYESLSAGIFPRAEGLRHATPILATDLAELLWRGHELRLQGLYHLAGAERTSAFRFVAQLAAACGLVASAAPAEMPQPAAATSWHDETSLNSRRARRALEMATPLVREGLDRFAKQATSGWRGQWRVVGQSSAGREVAA